MRLACCGTRVVCVVCVCDGGRVSEGERESGDECMQPARTCASATYLLLLPGLLLPLQIHGLLGGHGPATRRVGIRLVLRIEQNTSMLGKPCASRHCDSDKSLAHHHLFYFSQSDALAQVDHLRCDRCPGCRRHAEAELLFPGVLVADSPDLQGSKVRRVGSGIRRGQAVFILISHLELATTVDLERRVVDHWTQSLPAKHLPFSIALRSRHQSSEARVRGNEIFFFRYGRESVIHCQCPQLQISQPRPPPSRWRSPPLRSLLPSLLISVILVKRQ